MPIRLKYFDWCKPFLRQAADEIVESFRAEALTDLRGVVIVLPSKRAARRLEELLLFAAEESGAPLLGPEILTLGQLPEKIFQPKKPIATQLEQRLLWGEALRTFDLDDLSVIFPFEERLKQFSVVDRLAEALRVLWADVAGAGVRFSDVPTRAAAIEEFHEDERWLTLDKVYSHYLSLLGERGLLDPYEHRLQGLEGKSAIADIEIVLVGVIDMPAVMRMMLQSFPGTVHCYVFCAPSEHQHFDELGCVKTVDWTSRSIQLEEQQIGVGQSDSQQSKLAIKKIVEIAPKVHRDELALVVTNDGLAPYIIEQGSLADCEIRSAAGRLARDTRPVSLLRLLQIFLSGFRYRDLAALARHTDMLNWLSNDSSSSDLLAEVDNAYVLRLPAIVEVGEERGDEFDQCFSGLTELLREFRGKKVLAEWVPAFQGLLLRVYQGIELDQELTSVFEAVGSVFSQVQESAVAVQEISSDEALELVLRVLEAQNIAVEQHGQELELLGWLDIAFDEASHVVVVGMNEQDIPATISADMFLPNALRGVLGLATNDERLARDSYVLSSLLANRSSVYLTAAKNRSSGEPLLLSRLLLRDRIEIVAKRVQSFYDGAEFAVAPEGIRESGVFYEAPESEDLPALTSMPVTSFRSYLSCPYRFYLQYVLKLSEIRDDGHELDPMNFGTFAHDILSQFATRPSSRSTNVTEIEKDLHAILERKVSRVFTRPALPAVLVQMEQLRGRLSRFAEWQASWVANGWEIVHSELGFSSGDFSLSLPDGERMSVTGRIDRVDRNSKTGEWAVFDYKTSENQKGPELVHRKSGEWRDFQLPLYAEMLKQHGVDNPHLGYIPLPRSGAEVQPLFADWDQSEIAEAIDLASEIALSVRKRKFNEISTDPRTFDPFSAICGANVLLDQNDEED